MRRQSGDDDQDRQQGRRQSAGGDQGGAFDRRVLGPVIVIAGHNGLGGDGRGQIGLRDLGPGSQADDEKARRIDALARRVHQAADQRVVGRRILDLDAGDAGVAAQQVVDARGGGVGGLQPMAKGGDGDRFAPLRAPGRSGADARHADDRGRRADQGHNQDGHP